MKIALVISVAAVALVGCASGMDPRVTGTYNDKNVQSIYIDKSGHTLTLRDKDGNDLESFRAVFGSEDKKNKRKTCEGDNATPVGEYVVESHNSASKYHLALAVSYPNDEDSKRAKDAGCNPGKDIMIHGQKNLFGWFGFVTQRFNWTDGCIALSNGDIEKVYGSVRNGTKIIIVN